MQTAAALPEVFYAARTPLSAGLRRLLMKRWSVHEGPVSEVVSRDALPDFLWLDLGRVSKPATHISLIKSVAGKQAETRNDGFVFISGSVSKKTHEQLAEKIYENFSNPLLVHVDFAGEPDVVSALEKYRAFKRRSGPTTGVHKRNSAFEIPNADLRSETGRLSARLISDVFGIPMVELGNWIGSKKAALSKTPDAESIQGALQPYARVALFRKTLGGDTAFRQWLRTENPLLERKSPLDWLKLGRVREIADFVEDALTGQPT